MGNFATGVNNISSTGDKFAAGVVDTGSKFTSKFTTGVVDTSSKFATGIIDTGGAPWLANISVNLWKNLQMLFSGAWGRWFIRKTLSKNSRDTVLLTLFPPHKNCVHFSISVHLIETTIYPTGRRRQWPSCQQPVSQHFQKWSRRRSGKAASIAPSHLHPLLLTSEGYLPVQ